MCACRVQSSDPYDEFILNTPWDALPIAQLWRHSMHLPSGQIVRTRLLDKAVEFPAINPAFAGEPCGSAGPPSAAAVL